MSGFKLLREDYKNKKNRGNLTRKKEAEAKAREEKAGKWTATLTSVLIEKEMAKEHKLEIINILRKGREEIINNGELSPETTERIKRLMKNLK